MLEGNKRFVAGESTQPVGGALVQRRLALATNQNPFAVVVGCSDSRVSPELIFDVSLGDIFVVRTAGEVLDVVALGSIEFAIEYLGARLIVVLGHQRCGAVTAAVEGAKQPGYILQVLNSIAPAVELAKGQYEERVDKAVRANAGDVAKRLHISGSVIPPRVQANEVKIVAAYYSLNTGQVELLN